MADLIIHRSCEGLSKPGASTPVGNKRLRTGQLPGVFRVTVSHAGLATVKTLICPGLRQNLVGVGEGKSGVGTSFSSILMVLCPHFAGK